MNVFKQIWDALPKWDKVEPRPALWMSNLSRIAARRTDMIVGRQVAHEL